MIRSIIDLRRRRSSYLGNELFADPAWDMMLKLLLAELMQVRVTVSDLCEGAAVPATTALRWQKLLVERNLVVRRPDPHDARRAFVELSPKASEALNRYFADVDATRASGGAPI
jgi:DNA-binding MarR family transcriptional regulator